MKYIEENFKKIMGNQIPKDELEILKPFLSELKNNQAVECIFLVPTYEEIEYGREPFDYFHKRFYIIVNNEKTAKEEFEQIQRCIHKARFSLKKKGYFFVDEYEFYCIKEFDKFYWASLVSSYIIFDRNGKYERMQDELKIKVEPYKPRSEYYEYGSLAEIENIDELENEPIKRKTLNRNNNYMENIYEYK